MNKDINLVRNIVSDAAIYCPVDVEAIRIDYHEEEGGFYGQGEESGEEYYILYNEVDLKQDLFYKLVLIEVPLEEEK
jgi:hypothetical protein